MKTRYKNTAGFHTFLLLWGSQAISQLGSSMTSFALIIWSYQQSGSALTTSLLALCTYTPYVIFSMVAGTLSERWNKKYCMLISDACAAITTLGVLYLLQMQQLAVWHLYVINAINGLMNTLQQPASDVAISLVTPKHLYQRAGSLKSLSDSLITMLTPALASACYAFGHLQLIIFIDLTSFSIAWITLLCGIKIPEYHITKQPEGLWQSMRSAFTYLHQHRGIVDLILFLAAINITASIYQVALPAMLLSKNGGNEVVLGLVNTCCGCANVIGSIFMLTMKEPKKRIHIIWKALLFSMATENFFLAFGNTAQMWCIGAFLGWVFIPVMNTNLDVVLRTHIPIEMQSRVYAARNALQFFTIPIGYLLGGWLIDYVMEPWMAKQVADSIFTSLFGIGKGSGAALLFFFLACAGIGTCICFRKDPHIWELEDKVHQYD